MTIRLIAGFALAVSSLVVTPPSARAETPDISSYELRVEVRPDGSGHVALSVVLDSLAASAVVVPFPFADIKGLRLEASPDASFVTTPANRQINLGVTIPPGTTAPYTLRFVGEIASLLDADVKTGRSVRLSLLNSQSGAINNLRFVVLFPEGLRGHAIREALPKLGKTEVEPRAALEAIDGRLAVILRAKSLAQGETAGLQVELASTSPSLGWIVVGLALTVFYLLSFRDLVTRQNTSPDTRRTS